MLQSHVALGACLGHGAVGISRVRARTGPAPGGDFGHLSCVALVQWVETGGFGCTKQGPLQMKVQGSGVTLALRGLEFRIVGVLVLKGLKLGSSTKILRTCDTPPQKKKTEKEP